MALHTLQAAAETPEPDINPVVQQLILECLRYWTINYRVDGFRFDLASILGRNEDGSPMNNPPLLRTLADDSILSNVKTDC